MKLRLKYYKVIAVIALGLIIVFIPYIFIRNTTLSLHKDAMWLVFFLLLEVYTLIRLWKIILFEFYQVEFTQTTIKLKNIITRKETFIETFITKFKINPITGKLSLIDNENDVIVILNAFHYFNVPEALDYLNLRRNSG